MAIHLTLALYAHDDAKSLFIPNALFVDIGIMVKNVFFCIAKAKTDHPMVPFFIMLLGTDRLETLFGILRTMIGNDANLDMLQLALHVTATTEVSNILARHPEWDRRLRRLHLPNVSRDMNNIPRTADHIGPGAYTCLERLLPSTVTVTLYAISLCHALIFLSFLPLSVRPDRFTAVYRTHFSHCRYLNT
jgi:hypothetical protein